MSSSVWRGDSEILRLCLSLLDRRHRPTPDAKKKGRPWRSRRPSDSLLRANYMPIERYWVKERERVINKKGVFIGGVLIHD